MTVFLTALIFVIIAVCGEWRASFELRADITAGTCRIKVCVFGISIIRLDLAFDGFTPALGYVWLKANGRRVGISLTADESDRDSVLRYLHNPLADAVDVYRMRVGVRLGIAGYDAETAFAVQIMRMAAAAGVTMLKGLQRVEFSGNIRADFGKNGAYLHAKGIMGASPANIIYSFAAAAARRASAAKRMMRVRARRKRI